MTGFGQCIIGFQVSEEGHAPVSDVTDAGRGRAGAQRVQSQASSRRVGSGQKRRERKE